MVTFRDRLRLGKPDTAAQELHYRLESMRRNEVRRKQRLAPSTRWCKIGTLPQPAALSRCGRKDYNDQETVDGQQE